LAKSLLSPTPPPRPTDPRDQYNFLSDGDAGAGGRVRKRRHRADPRGRAVRWSCMLQTSSACRVAATVASYWILGAILSVCVAWSLDLWAPDYYPDILREPPIDERPWPRPVPADWPGLAMRWSGSNAWTTREYWTAYSPNPTDPRCHMRVWSAGWPARALGGAWFDGPGLQATEGLSVPAWISRHGDVVIAARPIWPGLAVDAAVTGLTAWAGVSLVAWRRRRWRRARGRCAGCGYDLAGAPSGPCPECGVATGPPSAACTGGGVG
jgi:hypothetical protein